jgi:glutamine amidotransferase-like uncharacterized protein
MKTPLLRTILSLTVGVLTCASPCAIAADAPAPATPDAPEDKPKPAVIPPDVNGYRTIVAPAAQVKPVKVAIFSGKGSPKSSVDSVVKSVASIPGATATVVSGEEMGTIDLKQFDVVVFGGGGGSSQAKTIGDAGRNNVREFVRGGGGYVGICAGAYLACSNFSWGLGLINASTVSSQWRRGGGIVELEVTGPGSKVLGDVKGTFKVRYNNGPIIKPGDATDLPAYTPVSIFRTELAENGTPVGVMVESPAQAISTFGKGRVFFSSPHAEVTPGLEHVIPRAILWASGVDAL